MKFDCRSITQWRQLWRYYQAGAVNTLFGYGFYSLLLLIGMNLFAAQGISHFAGVAFNHFTYSKYAFAGHAASKRKFVFSYLINYLASLACLAAVSRLLSSPYLAGLVTVLLVSVANYILLKRYVFIGDRAQ